MKKDFYDDLHLSLDPEETLRMENQLLELKLQAEFGAHTFLEGDFPPEVENTFLKNVLEFEISYLQSGETRVFDILGNPLLKPETALDDLELETALEEVNKLLLSHNIAVDFGGSYDTRTKYKFITEELLEESIFHAGVPGMMLHFIYEEFHPNHRIDLEMKSEKFISAWLEKNTDKLLWELGDNIILPDGPALSKNQVLEKLQVTFNRFILFSEYNYVIADINFNVNDDTGMALAEGLISYNALMANQEAIAVQGPFKLYFRLEHGWWDICYFVFPGFEFNPENTIR